MKAVAVQEPQLTETLTNGDGLPSSDWIYIPQFLTPAEADELYVAMAQLPWSLADDDKYGVHYGKPYGRGGHQKPEVPSPPFILPYADRVAVVAKKRSNYHQLHRMGPEAIVRPHKDPAGMIVPMLTLGQARTFRVGGKMPQFYYRMRQVQRKVEEHVSAEQIVMNHGDLLIFNGGHVLHSMFSAKDDPNFNPGPFDWRYSLIFRWTTDSMRQHGPGDKAREAGHDEQYRNDGNL